MGVLVFRSTHWSLYNNNTNTHTDPRQRSQPVISRGVDSVSSVKPPKAVKSQCDLHLFALFSQSSFSKWSVIFCPCIKAFSRLRMLMWILSLLFRPLVFLYLFGRCVMWHQEHYGDLSPVEAVSLARFMVEHLQLVHAFAFVCMWVLTCSQKKKKYYMIIINMVFNSISNQQQGLLVLHFDYFLPKLYTLLLRIE